MGNIRYSIQPETGLVYVENPSEGDGVELAKEDIMDLIKAVRSTKIKTGLRKDQFQVDAGGLLIRDKVQNGSVELMIDDIIELGNFVRKNKDRVASRKDFR